jgi:hypothetical protein
LFKHAHDDKQIAFKREKGDSDIYQDIIVRHKVNDHNVIDFRNFRFLQKNINLFSSSAHNDIIIITYIMVCHIQVDTVIKAFEYAVKRYGSRPSLGTRKILDVKDEVQANGKLFQKLALGEYEWLTYEQVHQLVRAFSAGLGTLGVTAGDRVTIYAETRAEWMVACLGAFNRAAAVATVYANLGDDAVVHALNETKVELHKSILSLALFETKIELHICFANLGPSQVFFADDQ